MQAPPGPVAGAVLGFPLAPPAPRHAVVPGGPAAAGARGRPPLRVLLVEDDPGDAFLVTELLDEVSAGSVDGGPVDVVHVTSLAAARHQLPSGFACVLLDLGLPDASGLEAIAGVLAVAGEAAVVCLTGADDEQRGAEAVAAGAQDYLGKGSVDGALLRRSIRYAVQRRQAEEQARQLVETRLRAAENARLERQLLPVPQVRDPHVSVTTRYLPGRGATLGGDFYDVVERPDGSLLVLLGDVAGHGPDEAALGVCLRIAWRTLVLAGTPVERLLPVVEDVLVRERRSEEVFTTAALVHVAPDRRSADLRLAGHPSPLLLDPVPRALPDDARGPALGLLPGAADGSTWPAQRVPLERAWRLLLHTDGVLEGFAGGPGERLGEEGLLRLVAAATLDGALDSAPDGALDGSPDGAGAAGTVAVLDRLLDDVRALNGGPLSDDVAVVVVAHA